MGKVQRLPELQLEFLQKSVARIPRSYAKKLLFVNRKQADFKHQLFWMLIMKKSLGTIKKVSKGGFKSEGTGGFLLLQKNIPNLYPEQKI